MRKSLSFRFNKSFLFCISWVCISAISVKAQTVTIGAGAQNGTSANSATGDPGPMYRSSATSDFVYSRHHYLYTQAELAAAGITPGVNITKLAWNKDNVAGTNSPCTFQIWIKNSSATVVGAGGQNWATLITGSTQVYNNTSLTLAAPAQFHEFLFNSPYLYTGGALEISVNFDISSGSTPWTSAGFSWKKDPINDRTLSYVGNTAPPATLPNLRTVRPQIQITYAPALPCTSPPVPGAATVSPSTPVCGIGTPITLNLTGNSIGSGQTYQWESSTNIAGPYAPVSGVSASTIFNSASPAVTTYYRAAVTCSGNTQYSTPVQLAVNPPLPGGVYTINSAVATGGTNYQSFTAAVNALACGISGAVVFNVDPGPASGPYNEQIILGAISGASATNTITFNGNGKTLQFLSTNANERAVIKLNNADYFIFNDLVINALGTSTTEYGFGIQLTNNADTNVVNNCTININTTSNSTTNYAGIVISGSATTPIGTGVVVSDGNTFSGNTITGGYYGITQVATFSGGASGNNKFINNIVRDFYQYGIYTNGSYNTVIKGNNFSRPTRTSVGDFNGIYFTGASNTALVTQNRIHNPFDGAPTSTANFYGIYFNSATASTAAEDTVSNNAIYNVNGEGLQYGLANVGSSNIWYFHNTVSLDNISSTSTAATRGFHQLTTAGNITFYDNMITIRRGGTGTKHCIYLGTSLLALTNYNNYYINAAAGNNNIGYFTTDRPTLVDWKAATGQEANSLSTNPVYTDPVAGNLAPTNAGIDNKGFFIGVTVDINNALRSLTTPDIGAFEFIPPVCTSPPVAGTTTISQATVCVNAAVQLGITGNTVGLGQTYQWQTATNIGGPYTNIGNVLTNADTIITSSSTFYYRVAVTCGGNTQFSTPVLLNVNPALPAGTYTIDQTGASTPDFLSFNEAKAALACGIDGPVVINVIAGTGPYLEQLLLDSIAGTSATNTITFNGNGNTIRFTSTTAGERAVIRLDGTDHVTFNNLIIDAPGTTTTEYGVGVQMMNNADFNTINNCTININTSSTSTTNYAGILINGSTTSITGTGDSRCDNNTLSSNTITGGYAGIAIVANGTTNMVNSNSIINNTIKDFYLYGIYLNGNAGSLVEANDISRPTRTAIGNYNGVYVTGGARSLRISKNRLHNAFDAVTTTTTDFYGVYFNAVDAPAGSENIVSNNVIYEVNNASDQYGFYNTGSDNVWYYHNTISFDYTGGTFPAADWSRGFYQTTAASGLRYRNNLVTIRRAGLGSRHAMYMATAATTYVADNNNYLVEVNGGTAFVGFNGTNQATLANWQTATGQDANSFDYNPQYVNPATGNFRPSFAPLDNKGAFVNITTDIVNQVRSNSTPDIGAWEFAVLPCTVPPVAGTASAVPNSGMCLGAPIQLSLTGNSEGAGMVFQWEVATAAAGPWSPLGTPMAVADTTIFAGGRLYYRVAVTCSGNTTFSTPVFINMNLPFPAGTYTINNTLPTDYPGGTNFNSFGEAVAVMGCGINGPVIFNAVPGTYNEQVRIRAIQGTSAVNTVTFKSQNGIPSSVVLSYTITNAAANYVLQLDSASHIIFRNMTITAAGTTNARAVELARTASNDTLLNLTINVPASTSTSNTIAGVVGTALTGRNNTIKGNIINNGSSGINITGASVALAPDNLVIDSNIVNNSYYYSIYTSNTKNTRVLKNIVEMVSPRNVTTYGIYGTNSDSAYQYVSNIVNINNVTSTTSYGIYLTSGDANVLAPGRVANNKVTALTGNTGILYGIYQTGTTNNSTVNNVVVINTVGASSYGLYSTAGGLNKYYNNSVNSVATSATNNYAAYFANTSGSGVDVRNNIFSHKGGGRAMYVSNTGYVYTDYNMLYTTGPTLVQLGTPATSFATLNDWRNASSSDPNSIVYPPAFTSTTNLLPNVNDPDAWAIHGRGQQIEGNNYDFNNNTRPATVVAGVPDLGAYEFLPVIAPPVLPATPAIPAAGTTQVFMFGTDTVTKISWRPASAVPSTVSVRRYSGVTPPGMPASAKYMYFYTDVDVTAASAPNYDLKQYYIDPWQGLIPREIVTRLGRTNAAGTWLMDPVSKVDSVANILLRDTLNFLDKFTGMTDGTILAPPPPPDVISIDSSNSGRKFWVAYPINQLNGGSSQEMVIYLSATQAANVQVKINGTNWVRNYAVPANSVVPTEYLPKAGFNNAFHNVSGFTERGISITSDVPIVAYAHYIGLASSGASMLLPVGVWGYEYKTLGITQDYGANSFAYYYVIADKDNTKIEITSAPGIPVQNAGMTPGVPFVVTLNRGEVYQVVATSQTQELSGSILKSIPNDQGVCYPFASFSGSSRTALDCPSGGASGGDFIMQQNFPATAWGKRYLTAPSSSSTLATLLQTNVYRVAVKDPTTVVTRNGVALTGLTNNFYYQFNSATADYIEADKPIMVAQFFAAGNCPGNGVGDPEMIYLSPIEQGIKQVAFYRNDQEAIVADYLTLIIPTNGLPSLTIYDTDTLVTPDYIYPHPQNAILNTNYSVVVKRWTSDQQQVQVISDSAFTAITYGLGSVESYGYNAGTLVKNLNAVGTISNVLASGGTGAAYTCVGTPFRFRIRLNVKPAVLTWHLSQVPGLAPNADSTQISPVPADSSLVNGQWYYFYALNQNFTMNTTGTFVMPATITHPSIEGCNSSLDFSVIVTVIDKPVTDFTVNFSGCVSNVAQFTGSTTTSNGVPVNIWNWNFGDNTTATIKDPTKQWSSPGSYNVTLQGIADDGCLDDTTKRIDVVAQPVVNIVPDSLPGCIGNNIIFSVQNPVAGAVYEWFTAPTGGTLLHTGSSYTFSIPGPVSYYVQATIGGCVSATRKKITVSILPNLAVPIVIVDTAGTNLLRFRWNAITGATGYEVSTDNGSTWVTPSSGSTGLTHTVTGLQVGQTVTLMVRALGGCTQAVSAPVTGITVTDQVYIPNAFTPNGDGLNDVLRVYSNVIRQMRFTVFNQWGEKIFESTNQNTAWDGTHQGKPQPSGVYMYVCDITMTDGSRIQRKGAINLVR